MTAPLTPQRNPMVEALVKLECGDGCRWPDCQCYLAPSPALATNRVLAVLDSLPVEVMAEAHYRADGSDWGAEWVHKESWLVDMRAAIAAVRATVTDAPA